MSNPLNISLSALMAFQRSLSTVSHNIANANTNGYTRQEVELKSRIPQQFGQLFMGRGVYASTINRVKDEFVDLQVRQSLTESARLKTFHALSSRLDNLLAEGQGSIAASMQTFFGSIQDIADNPTSSSARTVMLESAESLSNRFKFISQQLNDYNSTSNLRLQEDVAEVNSLAKGIADINRAILTGSTGGGRSLPNDLLDQRDLMINKLSQLVSVSTVQDASGTVNVFIGKGLNLVIGADTSSLSTIRSPENVDQLEVAYQTPAGSFSINNRLSGGSIGGLLDFQRGTLMPARNEIGRIAIVLADTFNDQHREGMDLNGALGGDFFNVPTPTTVNNTGNTGTANISAVFTDVTAMTASDYRVTYNGANFTLTRLSDNTAVSGAGPLVMDGMTVSMTAGANAGDSFLLRPSYNAANTFSTRIKDGREIAAAMPIRSQSLVSNTGSGSISSGSITNIAHGDLLDRVDIVFNNPATTFDILNITDGSTIASGVAYTSGGNIDFNGIRVSITGKPNSADRFRVEQNQGGYSDNRNAHLLSDLETGNFVGGTASYQQSYASLVGKVGASTRQAEINSVAQEGLLKQAQDARDSVSGVNLDEEAAKLLLFQKSYQAVAQVIATTDAMFQDFLNAVRR